MYFFFFFKQKTAYEMRIRDWSSDVCSSDLRDDHAQLQPRDRLDRLRHLRPSLLRAPHPRGRPQRHRGRAGIRRARGCDRVARRADAAEALRTAAGRSRPRHLDRKSTRLNSSTNAHLVCPLLLEKNTTTQQTLTKNKNNR